MYVDAVNPVCTSIRRRRDAVLDSNLALIDGLTEGKTFLRGYAVGTGLLEGNRLVVLAIRQRIVAIRRLTRNCDTDCTRIDGELVFVSDVVVLVIIAKDFLHGWVDIQHLLSHIRLRTILPYICRCERAIVDGGAAGCDHTGIAAGQALFGSGIQLLDRVVLDSSVLLSIRAAARRQERDRTLCDGIAALIEDDVVVLVLEAIAVCHKEAIDTLILAIDTLWIICTIGNLLTDIRLRCRIGADIIRLADGVLHRDLALVNGLAIDKPFVCVDSIAACRSKGNIIRLPVRRCRLAIDLRARDRRADRALRDGMRALVQADSVVAALESGIARILETVCRNRRDAAIGMVGRVGVTRAVCHMRIRASNRRLCDIIRHLDVRRIELLIANKAFFCITSRVQRRSRIGVASLWISVDRSTRNIELERTLRDFIGRLEIDLVVIEVECLIVRRRAGDPGCYILVASLIRTNGSIIGIALRRNRVAIESRRLRPVMAIGTDIGKLSHIIRNGQARKAVASGQFARRNIHIACSQASRLTAIDLRTVNRDGEFFGFDDLRRAVGDIVVVRIECGKVAAIYILACFELYRIDAFIGIFTISSLLAIAELRGVQVLARCSSRFRGCCTGRIGPLIGRIATGGRVRHDIRQRSAVYSHGLTILGTSACDRIRSARIAIGALTLDIDGQVDGGYGQRMRAIVDDIVVVVVVQHIEAMRRI